ncbi:carboxypeptidase-like regulatory domain-containing protein [Stieleria sp. ICT_E10.1]|uniref:carboxypeptidase-like regulatory domain-containing protein n=1 Tax=Stieleria sedimenti TaxID=2976331 RepID=UPI0021803CC4|nr:carboxypeptidase-like regulatory domain-containing protein [Stieleria sedimenti]MCS7470429.1 carboxypeptidase-like regulatory domain-containing protein [Stieleria sedimenti]
MGADDWYFVIQADGFATEFKKTSEQKLGSVLPMRFELKRGGSLVGTVRDEDGVPLADAKVSVSPADISMSPGYGKTATDSKGNYSFDGLPIGRPLRVIGKA